MKEMLIIVGLISSCLASVLCVPGRAWAATYVVDQDAPGAEDTNAGTEEKPFKTPRDVTVAFYEQCKKCHFANYTKTLDGVHYALMAKGNKQAALCVDCHGAHAIGRPTEPRSKISETCSGCHQAVYQTYVKSVHGKALVAGNSDVPVCTDCHRAHDIADPRGGALSLRTADICGRCHTNAKLMSRYGLSTNVVQTYLTDFHGMAATLQKGKREKGQGALAPGCTDCHGVHNIVDPDTKPRVSQSQTCANCHKEIYGKYAQSVHGKALIGTANGDVPTCIDCHGVHNIPDPRTAAFRLQSPRMCADCHTDPQSSKI